MDEHLEISDSGRKADRESVGLLVGSKRERRRMALTLLLLTRVDRPKARAWLGGREAKPTEGERAELRAEFDAVLRREREAVA